MDKILFAPDGAEEKAALERTTHLCIAAHEDDIEFWRSRRLQSASKNRISGSAEL